MRINLNVDIFCESLKKNLSFRGVESGQDPRIESKMSFRGAWSSGLRNRLQLVREANSGASGSAPDHFKVGLVGRIEMIALAG